MIIFLLVHPHFSTPATPFLSISRYHPGLPYLQHWRLAKGQVPQKHIFYLRALPSDRRSWLIDVCPHNIVKKIPMFLHWFSTLLENLPCISPSLDAWSSGTHGWAATMWPHPQSRWLDPGCTPDQSWADHVLLGIWNWPLLTLGLKCAQCWSGHFLPWEGQGREGPSICLPHPFLSRE